jgi:hypothetical protein
MYYETVMTSKLHQDVFSRAQAEHANSALPWNSEDLRTRFPLDAAIMSSPSASHYHKPGFKSRDAANLVKPAVNVGARDTLQRLDEGGSSEWHLLLLVNLPDQPHTTV